ncbi:hypothetical protein M3Y99_01543800 [Aphelenchoides fujianensis]|nr:hypothetical protein M3Y99_01543800 [Aphelenchoides fujianensis]
MLPITLFTLLLVLSISPMTAADPQCPDGVVAFAECDSTDDCARFDLTCLKLEDGQAFCCRGVDEMKAPNSTVNGQKSRKKEKAPEREETCFDNLGECGRKARICQRNQYYSLMKKNCRSTCGMC